MERFAPICFKLIGTKRKIKGVLFVGDSYVAKIGEETRQGCNFEFVDIGGAQAHDWKLNFENIIQRSEAEVVVI